jgi:hypothetical protein
MASPRKKVIPKLVPRSPATGRGRVSAIRISEDIKAQVAAWARRQSDKPSLSEAIRQLLERALSNAESSGQRSQTGARLAEKLAAREIEGMVDQSHPKAEQHRRKRRLLKGPGEFREMRGDQPKRK